METERENKGGVENAGAHGETERESERERDLATKEGKSPEENTCLLK